jgi:hypothetical protein
MPRSAGPRRARSWSSPSRPSRLSRRAVERARRTERRLVASLPVARIDRASRDPILMLGLPNFLSTPNLTSSSCQASSVVPGPVSLEAGVPGGGASLGVRGAGYRSHPDRGAAPAGSPSGARIPAPWGPSEDGRRLAMLRGPLGQRRSSAIAHERRRLGTSAALRHPVLLAATDGLVLRVPALAVARSVGARRDGGPGHGPGVRSGLPARPAIRAAACALAPPDRVQRPRPRSAGDGGSAGARDWESMIPMPRRRPGRASGHTRALPLRRGRGWEGPRRRRRSPGPPGIVNREGPTWSEDLVELRLAGLDSPLLDDIEEEILPLAR